MGHVGDSRAYLFRDGEISQLTNDHTFVQSLIDEGRITEDEARVHPHRNLILKAIDGVHDSSPTCSSSSSAGDRLLLCSDGAAASSTPAGSPTSCPAARPTTPPSSWCAPASRPAAPTTSPAWSPTSSRAAREDPAQPLLVGAAADCRRRAPAAAGSLFRGHRAGDTGELEPSAPRSPTRCRFAIATTRRPRAGALRPAAAAPLPWLSRLLALAVVIGSSG
jgi:protein phosphatase